MGEGVSSRGAEKRRRHLEKLRIDVIRIIGLLLVVSALAWGLHQGGIQGGPLVAWIVLSAAIVLVGEWHSLSELYGGDSFETKLSGFQTDLGKFTATINDFGNGQVGPAAEQIKFAVKEVSFASEQVRFASEQVMFAAKQVRKDATRSLIEVALLLVSAFGFFSVFHTPLPPVANGSMTIRFSENTEKALAACLEKQSCGPPVASISNEVTVKLSPALERELLDHLKQRPTPETGVSWGTILVILVIGIGAVFIGLAIRKRPSATPLAVVSAIALAMINAAPSLPRPGGAYFWYAVSALVLIGALLLMIGVAQVWSRGGMNSGNSEGAEKAGNKESFLTLGFSLLVLTWTLLLVIHRPDVQAPPCQSDSPNKISASFVGPATQFDPSSAEPVDPRKLNVLIERLAKESTGRGDMLLLIGSADCTPIRDPQQRPYSNQKLASDRAEEVEKLLRSGRFGNLSGLEIATEVLPQYAGCKGTQDLRAVYPFLIRSKNAPR